MKNIKYEIIGGAGQFPFEAREELQEAIREFAEKVGIVSVSSPFILPPQGLTERGHYYHFYVTVAYAEKQKTENNNGS